MANLLDVKGYRRDIDGLRAIAVIAVIVFHFGHLPNGYLGVDVFFVISGYLITGILYRELLQGEFSLKYFYIRRIRRIIPLSLFISVLALGIGIFTMLPDDLENLSQSVVATSFFSNNILQAITTRNYWDVVNEYKPLMHTWSLGIEEQYYLFYPFLFLVLGRARKRWILPLLGTMTLLSFVLFLMPFHHYEKFYHIPFRFYELSIGGLAAILLHQKVIQHRYTSICILGLVALMLFKQPYIPSSLLLVLSVLLTLGILISSNKSSRLSSFILENKLVVGLGKISFSLYMWHQVLLAFARYCLFQELKIPHLIGISILTCVLSIVTYYLIEQPFRAKDKIPFRSLMIGLVSIFVLVNGLALFIYFQAGILRDVPELDIKRTQSIKNAHSVYNHRVHAYNKDFRSSNKVKVLVLGNSFSRDWANVLLESKYKDWIELSYFENYSATFLPKRAKKADLIFSTLIEESRTLPTYIPRSKLYIIGEKNFGSSMGIYYNYRGKNYYKQRAPIRVFYLENERLGKLRWKHRYMSIFDKILDTNKTVPVFTPTKKFISQDCRHLTKAGAVYFAQLFHSDLKAVLRKWLHKRHP